MAGGQYSKGSARQSEWRVNAIGQGKGKKRKGEKDGEIGNQLCSQGPAMTKPLSARQAPARLCTVDTTGRWELQRYLGPSVRHLVLLDRMLYNADLKISSREADRCWAMYFIKIHCTGPPGTDAWSTLQYYPPPLTNVKSHQKRQLCGSLSRVFTQ